MTDAGENVTPTRAMQHSTVFQCARVLAEGIGSLPIALYKKQGKTRERATDHAVHKIINKKPNSFQTAAEFWEMCMVHLCFRGNFYAYINRTGSGKPGELIPFHPDAVKVKQHDDYSIEYTVTDSKGKQTTYTEEDIFHVKIFSMDGVVGMNPIAYARNSVGLGIALERHGARTFKNGARPSGLLSTPSSLTPEQAKDQKALWNDAHSGDDSGGTAVLGNGLQYQAMALSAVDAQWLESRKFQKSDIAALYRVPPHKINELERSTNNNIEHQSLEFVRDTLSPYAVKIEQRIAFSLLSAPEQKNHYAKFNFNGLLRGDMKARAQFYKDMVNMGAFSPNEVRGLEDHNPRDGGDVYLTPINMAHDGKPLTGTPATQSKEQDDA